MQQGQVRDNSDVNVKPPPYLMHLTEKKIQITTTALSAKNMDNELNIECSAVLSKAWF